MLVALSEECFGCRIFRWDWSARELGEEGHGDGWVLVTKHGTPEHGSVWLFWLPRLWELVWPAL